MIVDLDCVFNAGRVRRWHTSPQLSHTNDYLDGHQGRVARIILALHLFPSRALIIAALTHDDGEHATGDIARPVKDAMRQFEPAAWARFEAVETDARADVWGDLPKITPIEDAWLTFADKLDAYMWADRHGVDMTRNGWPDDRDWLDAQCYALGLGLLDCILVRSNDQ